MEESTDDDATKLEKTEMSKQSCEKQSQFVLIKKPDKKMKITKSKKNQRPLKKDLSSFLSSSKILKMKKTATVQKTIKSTPVTQCKEDYSQASF